MNTSPILALVAALAAGCSLPVEDGAATVGAIAVEPADGWLCNERTDCPHGQCTVPTCENGICGKVAATPGMNCAMADGSPGVCDVNGGCSPL